MRRMVLVQLFAAAAGGLLLLAPGSTGIQPNRNPSGQPRNLVAAAQPTSIHEQKRAGGCETSGLEDPFALNPGRRRGASVPLFDNDKLPPAIQVDSTRNRVLTTRIGVGVQVYDHDRANGRWVFREPAANLYDIEARVQRGIHFAGPYWTDTDGGRVKAKVSGEVEAPTGSQRNIKWLRLEAVEKFGGSDTIFSQVTFIQRVATDGGQPPATGEPAPGCDTVSVPYTTLYVFWGPKEQ